MLETSFGRGRGCYNLANKQNPLDAIQCQPVELGGMDAALSPALYVTTQLHLVSPVRLNISFPFYRSNAQRYNTLSGIFTDTQLVNLTAAIHTQAPMTAFEGSRAGAGLEDRDHLEMLVC